jgi:hypothetical protein
LSQPTLAEPNLTVRATGSGRRLDFGNADDAPDAKTELHDVVEHSGAVEHSGQFADLTEAQLSLGQDWLGPEPRARLEAEPLTASESPERTLSDSSGEHAVSAPPTSRSRTRSNVGSFEAVRVPREDLREIGTDAEPQVLSVKTVSLRKTLAPLAAGVLAIVLLVTGLTSSSRPSDAADRVTDKVAQDSEAAAAELGPSSNPAQDPLGGAHPPEPTPPPLDVAALASAALAASSSSSLAEPPPTAPVQPERPGRLSVQSIPSADLVVAGKRRGRTPLRGLRLAPGEYRVVLSHPDHGRRVRTVRVNSEQLTAITVRFGDKKETDVPEPAASLESPPPDKTSAQVSKAPPPTRNCSPRWYVDDRGVKRIKPECLVD